ncbi:MAG: APC family permease [Candidatus Hydrogenedentes bacterium]|nr:APC family permease [Candidatus Hydrogenedentota bacterium]
MADGHHSGGDMPHLQRNIGLIGATALVVGGVIGSAIFALVREMTMNAGHALWLAFLLAMAVSVVGVIPLIQLAVVFPRAGAGYLFASRLISPAVGAVTSCCVILGGACSTIVVTLTLANYFIGFFALAWPPTVVGLVILGVFYAIYWGGVRLAMGLQVLMAIQFLIALGIYAIAGVRHVDLQIALVSPKGGGGMFLAFLLCYLTCLGFQVVAEMGEEITHPRRNIPLALAIGGVIVTIIYIIVGTVFASAVPYEDLAALSAPLADSAQAFLPPWAIQFLFLGALTAGLTSLNAAAIALPREMYAQARDGIAPRVFAEVDRRTHAPMHAVSAYFAVVVLLLVLGLEMDYYGYMAAVGIQAMSGIICIAALRLPARFPDRHAHAYFRVPRWLLWSCTVITIVVAVGSSLLLSFERPSIPLTYAATIGLVVIYYRLRIPRLRRSGFPFDHHVRLIPGEEEAHLAVQGESS